MRECPLAAGDGGFGRETLAPEVAAQVVSDFVEALAFDLLQDDAAVADNLLGLVLNLGILSLRLVRLRQFHGPEADAVVLIASEVAFNPLLNTGAIVGRGVKTHGLRIGED